MKEKVDMDCEKGAPTNTVAKKVVKPRLDHRNRERSGEHQPPLPFLQNLLLNLLIAFICSFIFIGMLEVFMFSELLNFQLSFILLLG